ncbi:MAG: arginine repressor [Lachnospiraceae bacterium]|nr:arginine repressor [Lachnospiraceae bacterium]
MKRTRQSKIRELISQYEIETQEELGRRLMEAGFAVTQATISRDIRELALTKVAGKDGRPKYAAMDYGGNPSPVYSGRYARVLQEGLVSLRQADNLVVIKTVSGMAMAVAAAIDALGIEEIVGSIAGDDTIMCAVETAELVPGVIEKIRRQ